MFEKLKAKIKEGIDKKIKDEIHTRFREKEEEVLEKVIDEAVYVGTQVIDKKLKHLFKDFFIKICINLFPVAITLIIYLINPTDFTKRILITGYIISVLISLYEFIKFSTKSWKFLYPIVKDLNIYFYSPILYKMYIKSYLQNKFLINDLYYEILNKGKEQISKKLNTNKVYKFLKNCGYEYKNVHNNADEITQHIVYETPVPDIIWKELVKYIKYSLLTKWFFASILVISYIVIFRTFILPIFITHL